MKKRTYLVLALLACCTACCWSQNKDTLKEEFEKAVATLTEKENQVSNDKDYAQVEQCYWDVLHKYEQLPKEEQQEIGLDYGACYYNITCCQALQGKKEEALKSFEQAYRYGYTDYRHTLEDTDLDNIRKEKAFAETLAKIRNEGDYLYILQQSPRYTRNERTDTLPRFKYPHPNDRKLVEVRQYFKLDSVAGAGDELSKIKNILTYIHNTIKHDGQHEEPAGGIIEWAEACKSGARGLHCGALAEVLKTCYLSMGFKARRIVGLPKKYVGECHSINVVYSNTLDKWIWVDPTNNAWVTDENGTMLSVQEVRERLRDGRPLILNEEANWNNQEKITKEFYLDNYMAKNLYSIQANDVLLCPSDPNAENFFHYKYVVNDDAWFWQSPYQE